LRLRTSCSCAAAKSSGETIAGTAIVNHSEGGRCAPWAHRQQAFEEQRREAHVLLVRRRNEQKLLRGTICRNAGVRADRLHDHVWGAVKGILQEPERVVEEWT
jgi:hypothetical protein